MRNIKLIIEYDGTGYHGWQSQNNVISVQQTIEDALTLIMKESISLIGASRTDAGVHALGQTANFHTNCGIPAEKIPFALNAVLPDDIVIRNACEVPEDFHSRFSSKGKRYKYIINNNRIPSALGKNREYFCPYRMDYELMRKAASMIVGTHDFKSFMAAGSNVTDTVRTITSFDVEADGGRLNIEICGTGFLYNMVRILVGTLIDVGRMKIPLENVEKLLLDGDRQMAGRTVPPQGLYLMEVYY